MWQYRKRVYEKGVCVCVCVCVWNGDIIKTDTSLDWQKQLDNNRLDIRKQTQDGTLTVHQQKAFQNTNKYPPESAIYERNYVIENKQKSSLT